MVLNELQKEHRRYEAMYCAHKSEIVSLKAEIASLKQSQLQQFSVLTKLEARVEASQNGVRTVSAASGWR